MPDLSHSHCPPESDSTALVCVSIAIPVYNEEKILAQSIRALTAFLEKNVSTLWQVTIADNGSTDGTFEAAQSIAVKDSRVRVLHLEEKGRGGALRAAWTTGNAQILSYMDVDLSTDLCAFPAMLQGLASGGFDVATGSRLHPESLTHRCWKREVTSRAYNRLVRGLFRTRFTDAQCGFKAITRHAAEKLLPLVHDTGWFFDTELLVLAERARLCILDLPVKWTERTQSSVRVVPTVLADLWGVVELWVRLRGCAPAAEASVGAGVQ